MKGIFFSYKDCHYLVNNNSNYCYASPSCINPGWDGMTLTVATQISLTPVYNCRTSASGRELGIYCWESHVVSPGYPTWPLPFSLSGLASFHIGPQSRGPCLPLGPVTELVSWDLPLLLSVSTAVVWDSSDGNSASWIQSHTIFLAEADDVCLFHFWVTRRSRAVCANGLAELYCPRSSCFHS